MIEILEQKRPSLDFSPENKRQVMKKYKLDKKVKDVDLFMLIIDTYLNYLSFRKITVLSSARITLVASRMKEYDKSDFSEMFKKAKNSKFLNSENGRGWVCNFDFLFSKNGFLKVLEGNYDNPKQETMTDLKSAIMNIYA